MLVVRQGPPVAVGLQIRRIRFLDARVRSVGDRRPRGPGQRWVRACKRCEWGFLVVGKEFGRDGKRQRRLNGVSSAPPDEQESCGVP